MNLTFFQKIKLGFVALFGGVESIVKFLCDWFNERVLAKIKDKEEAANYAKDIQSFGDFLKGVMNRHNKWMSEAKRNAYEAIISTIDELAKALEDNKLEPEEIDTIIDRVKEAIDTWKKVK